MTPKSKIAIIGTGIMGHGMALNFLKKGFEVYAWNRSPEKYQDLIELGAIGVKTPKEATKRSDLIFEVTANDESSKKVWTGEDGILSGADKNKILVTSATLSIDWTDRLIKLCKDKRVTFFDIPLTGGRIGAEQGQLTLLVGGDEQKLDSIQETLKAVAQKIFYFGKAGSGMKYKLLLNTLQAIHVVALGEVLRIAQKEGLDIKRVGDALADRPGGTVTNLAWRDYQTEPDPINFSIEWITKDLSYARRFADGLDTPLLNEVLRQYRKALKQDLGQKDWTEINKIP